MGTSSGLGSPGAGRLWVWGVPGLGSPGQYCLLLILGGAGRTQGEQAGLVWGTGRTLRAGREDTQSSREAAGLPWPRTCSGAGGVVGRRASGGAGAVALSLPGALSAGCQRTALHLEGAGELGPTGTCCLREVVQPHVPQEPIVQHLESHLPPGSGVRRPVPRWCQGHGGLVLTWYHCWPVAGSVAHARCQMLPWVPRLVHSTTSSPLSGRSLRFRVPGQRGAWGSHPTPLGDPAALRVEPGWGTPAGCHGARTNLWASQAVPERETAWGSGQLLAGGEELGPLPVAPWHRGVHGQEVA